MERIANYNNKILRWARIYSRTTEEELFNRFKNHNYLDWEEKTKLPTYKQLEKLIAIYKLPLAVLFFPEPPNIKGIDVSFRTLPKHIRDSLTKDTIDIINTARYYQINLSEMFVASQSKKENILNFNVDNKNIYKMVDNLNLIFNTPYEFSLKKRSSKQLFDYWRDIFFEYGIYVFKDSFKDKTISGFCLFDEHYPVIYINNKMSFTRQLFTLFHELYHLLSSIGGIDFLNDDFISDLQIEEDKMIEYKCNSFAAEFLVPTKSFISIVGQEEITQILISNLSSKYRVSREVVLRKLLDLNKIEFNYYMEYKNKYNEDYFRNSSLDVTKSGGNYFNTQISYRGSKYIELAFENYYSERCSLSKLSEYMNMKIPHLKKIANIKGWGEL